MTDTADSGVTSPTLTAEQSEQLRAVMIDQITQATAQLLALVGIVVDLATVSEGATMEFALQQELLPQMIAVLQDTTYPMFGINLKREAQASRIVLPGQPPSAPSVFPIAGPKHLVPGDHLPNIAATLAALAFLMFPPLRLAAVVLGAQIEFTQAPAPKRPFDGKFKGPAR